MTNEITKARASNGASDERSMDLVPATVSSVLGIAAGARPADDLAHVLRLVPRSARWCGRHDRPWGLGDDFKPRRSRPVRDLETVRMGKDSWFFRANGLRSYDTLREAFVGERLNSGAQGCGCISAYAFGVATIDCDAQLELIRKVLNAILCGMPDLDLARICDEMFGGRRDLCEHYLWWLETEAFVAHPAGEERQDRLMLTDEGCAVLAMLEMTKPGSNHDLSPEAAHRMREREGLTTDADRPRFLGTAGLDEAPHGSPARPVLQFSPSARR